MPDKEFSGTERAGMSRSGPVQFEKEELDPCGLDAFRDTAKRASKRNNEEDRRKEDRCVTNKLFFTFYRYFNCLQRKVLLKRCRYIFCILGFLLL